MSSTTWPNWLIFSAIFVTYDVQFLFKQFFDCIRLECYIIFGSNNNKQDSILSKYG